MIYQTRIEFVLAIESYLELTGLPPAAFAWRIDNDGVFAADLFVAPDIADETAHAALDSVIFDLEVRLGFRPPWTEERVAWLREGDAICSEANEQGINLRTLEPLLPGLRNEIIYEGRVASQVFTIQ